MNEPVYILVSTKAQGPQTSTLSHPTIQYHYLGDNPQALIPQPGEALLLLDHNPQAINAPTVKSLSSGVAVTDVTVKAAPDAGAEFGGLNERMYVLGIAPSLSKDKPKTSLEDPYSVLAIFKRRNTVVRQMLSAPQAFTSST